MFNVFRLLRLQTHAFHLLRLQTHAFHLLRLQTHEEVSLLRSPNISPCHQALPLPQLSREQGGKLVVAATGRFPVHKGDGVITNTRTVEVRPAREADNTGDIHDYNFLASLLPQDSYIWFQR